MRHLVFTFGIEHSDVADVVCVFAKFPRTPSLRANRHLLSSACRCITSGDASCVPGAVPTLEGEVSTSTHLVTRDLADAHLQSSVHQLG